MGMIGEPVRKGAAPEPIPAPLFAPVKTAEPVAVPARERELVKVQ